MEKRSRLVAGFRIDRSLICGSLTGGRLPVVGGSMVISVVFLPVGWIPVVVSSLVRPVVVVVRSALSFPPPDCMPLLAVNLRSSNIVAAVCGRGILLLFQLMHVHSSVRSIASKEVTFTLHYIVDGRG